MRRGQNASSIRQENRRLVLAEIRNRSGVSRAELSHFIGLSKGGLTPIVQELLELGLIQEQARLSEGTGRRPVGLTICPDRCACLSLDWSRRGIEGALVDFSGTILTTRRILFRKDEPLAEALEQLRGLGADLLAQAGSTPVVGVGLVAPGPIHPDTGMILSPPHFHGWRDIPVKQVLESAFSLPVWVENNSRAHALAERDYGVGKILSSFFHIVVDEGIGGALVLEGLVSSGAHGMGGEIGHVSLDLNGPRCPCGNQGCAELYASIPRLVEWVNRQKQGLLLAGQESGPLEVSWEQLLVLLREGDSNCLLAMEREACTLGRLLVSLWNLLDPEAIVIGSQLAQAGDDFLIPLHKWIEGKAIGGTTPRVLLSSLEHPALLGGAAGVWEQFLSGKLGEYEKILSLKETPR